jgi:hypothetical protein
MHSLRGSECLIAIPSHGVMAGVHIHCHRCGMEMLHQLLSTTQAFFLSRSSRQHARHRLVLSYTVTQEDTQSTPKRIQPARHSAAAPIFPCRKSTSERGHLNGPMMQSLLLRYGFDPLVVRPMLPSWPGPGFIRKRSDPSLEGRAKVAPI